jgi:hypothetical protein
MQGKLNLIIELQKLIVKINNLVQHIDEPEYLVDLVSDDLLKQYGRERIEEAARVVLKECISQELSEKFTKLMRQLDERHFGAPPLSPLKVEVRYNIDRAASTNMCTIRSGDGVIELPASSEAVMVERLLEEMLRLTVGRGCWECYVNGSNRLYFDGAPMKVEPEMRHLSAEEFIAKATREPIRQGEEHGKLLLPQNPPAERAVGA